MTICVVGFINAGNIADGANGLLSTIAVVVFLVGYLETGAVLFNALLLSTFIFSLYNMLTGSLFLGDSGAYFLSALMAMTCVDLYIQGGSSVWFYACFLGYPCVELLRIMYLRWSVGQSLFSADNNHFHNLLFEKLKSFGLSSQVGNTCTGFSIAAVSVAVPLLVYLINAIPLDSPGWMLIFVLYCLVHLSVGRYLSRK
jgi:UDP-N-acetylmuramyl pentapeptide phosphotransferase/UDP-N-acetylglucosamine-1-phosphate transferase